MISEIHSDRIIGDCLEKVFDLKTYVRIMDYVSATDFKATPEFRKLFNRFYKVRQRPKEWYIKYYTLMEEQKIRQRSLEEILKELSCVKQTIEVSFASKLIATIDPDMPIWDQYVLRNLGLEKEWNKCQSYSKEERIDKAVEIYKKIQTLYVEFMNGDEGKKCIEVIDAALPQYAKMISITKKIDYILWSKR